MPLEIVRNGINAEDFGIIQTKLQAVHCRC